MATVLGLTGKVAIVTGATSGIGWAIALAFAKEEIYLTVTGRNEEALREIAKKCQECGIPQDKTFGVIIEAIFRAQFGVFNWRRSGTSLEPTPQI